MSCLPSDTSVGASTSSGGTRNHLLSLKFSICKNEELKRQYEADAGKKTRTNERIKFNKAKMNKKKKSVEEAMANREQHLHRFKNWRSMSNDDIVRQLQTHDRNFI